MKHIFAGNQRVGEDKVQSSKFNVQGLEGEEQGSKLKAQGSMLKAEGAKTMSAATDVKEYRGGVCSTLNIEHLTIEPDSFPEDKAQSSKLKVQGLEGEEQGSKLKVQCSRVGRRRTRFKAQGSRFNVKGGRSEDSEYSNGRQRIPGRGLFYIEH